MHPKKLLLPLLLTATACGADPLVPDNPDCMLEGPTSSAGLVAYSQDIGGFAGTHTGFAVFADGRTRRDELDGTETWGQVSDAQVAALEATIEASGLRTAGAGCYDASFPDGPDAGPYYRVFVVVDGTWTAFGGDGGRPLGQSEVRRAIMDLVGGGF